MEVAQTVLGIIPSDWKLHPLPNLTAKRDDSIKIGPFGSQLKKSLLTRNGYKIYGQENIYKNDMTIGERYIPKEHYIKLKSCGVNSGDFLISMMGTIGKCIIVSSHFEEGIIDSHLIRLRLDTKIIDSKFLLYLFSSAVVLNQISKLSVGAIMEGLSSSIVKKLVIPLPPTLKEQAAIATSLSDVDALISNLEKLIAKKRNIKQGALQQRITEKKHLPGFSGKFRNTTIKQTTICLDTLRIPLNEMQRSKMKGEYPYCGANGILDYVNDFVIDDDIILIAEDGGYFSEYYYRPIAYRMKGKSWVNNHVHILKATEEYDQNYIFYSLVNKNILKYLASGTRDKLNKSEMYKIDISVPESKEEQYAISNILDEMSSEIQAFEQKLDKYRLIKQGMMGELLTGKKRLI